MKFIKSLLKKEKINLNSSLLFSNSAFQLSKATVMFDAFVLGISVLDINETLNISPRSKVLRVEFRPELISAVHHSGNKVTREFPRRASTLQAMMLMPRASERANNSSNNEAAFSA
jgi:hypothetical protein